MKSFLFITVILMALSGYSQKTWKLDKENSSVTFKIIGESDEGKLEGLEADIKFDPESPETSSFKAKIPVETINTGIDQRDEHLRAEDFFYVEEYPYITFTSEEIVQTESGYIAKGELTIRGKTNEVEMPFVWEADSKRFIGRLKVATGDFGVPQPEPGEKQGNYKIVVRIIAAVTE